MSENYSIAIIAPNGEIIEITEVACPECDGLLAYNSCRRTWTCPDCGEVFSSADIGSITLS